MKRIRIFLASVTIVTFSTCAVTGSLEYETADGKTVKIGHSSDGKTTIDLKGKEDK